MEITDENSIVGTVERYFQSRRTPPLKPLSEYIANRVSSKSNLDFRMLFVGAPGTGKSWAALSLAERTAKKLAAIHGKPPKSFFSERNIIYGTPDDVYQAINRIKQYGVYLIDDIGVSLNSRRFASATNMWFSSVFQTCRTDNAVILMTAPDPFLIDKVPRSMVHCFAEMQQPSKKSIRSHSRYAKVFTVSKNFRTNKTYFKYLRAGNRVYTSFRFPKPSDQTVVTYERFRRQIAAMAKIVLDPAFTPGISPSLDPAIRSVVDVGRDEEQPFEERPPKRKHATYLERTALDAAAQQIFKVSNERNISVEDATRDYNSSTESPVDPRKVYSRLYYLGLIRSKHKRKNTPQNPEANA